MNVRSFAAIILTTCLLSLGAYSADTLSQNDLDRADAIKLLQGHTKKGFIAEDKISEIVSELEAIHKADPKLTKIHAYGTNKSSISIRLKDKMSAQILNHLSLDQRKEFAQKFQKFTLDPADTGSKKWDRLNKIYDVTSIKGWASRSDSKMDDGGPTLFITVTFKQPLDTFTVSRIYQNKISHDASTSPYGEMMAGSGHHITRIEKPGEPLHYVLEEGYGDCPAGCTEIYYHFFNLVKDSSGIHVESVPQPGTFGSLWGQPARFSLRVFSSFDDLMAKTKDPNWSVRLHAVSALGRVYANASSGLGEDDFAYKPEDQPAINTNKEIIAAVMAQREQIGAYLQKIGKSDKDADVRAAAQESLQHRIRNDAYDAEHKQDHTPPPAPDLTTKNWWKSLRWQ